MVCSPTGAKKEDVYGFNALDRESVFVVENTEDCIDKSLRVVGALEGPATGGISYGANDFVRLNAAIRLPVDASVATTGLSLVIFSEVLAAADFVGLRTSLPYFMSKPRGLTRLCQSRAVASGTRFTIASSSVSSVLVSTLSGSEGGRFLRGLRVKVSVEARCFRSAKVH